MKAQGIPLIRTPEQLLKHTADTVMQRTGKSLEETFPGMTNQKMLRASEDKLKNLPGGYVHKMPSIIIPRKKYLSKEVLGRQIDTNNLWSAINNSLGGTPEQVNLDISPRKTLFHEFGHAQHHLDDPQAFKQTPLLGNMAEAMLARERIANNNALLFMRENNVPMPLIEDYIRGSGDSYGTYLTGFKYDPSQYQAPHSLDMLYWYRNNMNSKQASEKPGLWANIRAKRARGEKAAKPGDKDYPDKKTWNKLTR